MTVQGFNPHPLRRGSAIQTEWVNGRPVVTVNSLISQIVGVRDINGIENVCLSYEGIHLLRDLDLLAQGPTLPLGGFDVSSRITC